MIFAPPRHGKTELASRRLPAMIHGKYPDDQIIAASYGGSLASEICQDVERILDSAPYRELFPETKIAPEGSRLPFKRSSMSYVVYSEQETPKGIERTRRGKYLCGGMQGSFTGKGANWLLIDDPYKNQQEAESETVRNKVWSTFNSSLLTRLEDPYSICLVLTRWHEDDLAGRLLKMADEDPDAIQWEVISYQAIKEEPIVEDLTSVGQFKDYSALDDFRQPGEPLWPEKYPLERLNQIKKNIGDDSWYSMYQQTPVQKGGNIVQASEIKFYTDDMLPKEFDEEVITADLASKGNKRSDFNVFDHWGRKGANFYLLGKYRERKEYKYVEEDFEEFCESRRNCYGKYIEDKANGPALMSRLSDKISGLMEFKPGSKDKVERFRIVSPLFRAGNVWLPLNAPWTKKTVEIYTRFPRVANDDDIDTCYMALSILSESGGSHFAASEPIKNIRERDE